MKKNNRKGFTLAELLIVVAIIAVLVAISIPVFTTQLEKARQATDAANIRSAYAEAVVKTLEAGTDQTVATSATMKSDSWDKLTDGDSIGGVAFSEIKKTKGAVMNVTAHANGSAPTFAAGTAPTT